MTSATLLQMTDLAIRVAGLGCLCVWTVQLRRCRVGFRVPETFEPQRAPDPEFVILALGAYLLLPQLIVSLGVQLALSAGFLALPGDGNPVGAGSALWYWRQSLGFVGYLSFATMILWAGWRMLSFAPQLPVAARPTLAVGATCSALAVALSQLELLRLLVQTLYPEFEFPEHSSITALRGATHAWGVAVLISLGALVAAPLAEEVMFRGVLLQGLLRVGGHFWRLPLAVGGSSLAFALIHFSTPDAWLALFSLGVILCYVRLRAGLAWAVVVHALFNLRTVAALVLNPTALDGA